MSDRAARLVDEEFGGDHGLIHQSRQCSYEPSESQRNSQRIMGDNLFGIGQAMQHIGVKPSERELAAFAKVPFAEHALRECRYSHVLVVVFPVSILAMRNRYRQLFYRDQVSWYPVDPAFADPFLTSTGEPGWYLGRKDVVPGSLSKVWEEQQTLLVKSRVLCKS